MVERRTLGLAACLLLVILVSSIVLATREDPPPSTVIPLVILIAVPSMFLCIGAIDAVKPGIFDSCADPNDIARRDALREARIVDTPV